MLLALNKVRILITDFFGIMAGSTYSAYYLAMGLKERGHHVWVAYKQGSFMEKLVEHSNLEKLPFKRTGKFNLLIAWRLAKIAKKYRIEVVNAQASPDRYLTIFARTFFGMPGKLFHTRRQRPVAADSRLKSWFYSRGTDGIIAVGKSIKHYLSGMGIPEKHIEVINNGIPEWKMNVYDPDHIEELRLKYKIEEGNLVIGCVARIKRQHEILKALHLIETPAKVILVGIDDKHNHLKDLINDLPTRHNVFFTGEIANKAALQHYSLFDMMILPSVTEGFSQSILESMAYRVPVIATKASGNADLITHGVNGFLYDEGDIEKIAVLIDKVERNAQDVKAVIEQAFSDIHEKYLLEKVVATYEAFYQRALQIR